MYHYLYKIINTTNSKYYIGIHSTNDIDDSYMGSGIAITEAIKKHGAEFFTKEILQFFDTREDALEKEAQVVNDSLVRDLQCYNLTSGGNAPPSRLNISHTDKTKTKISAYQNSNIEQCKENGKKSWEVRKSKGGWSKEEILKRVETRKTQGTYSKDMAAANTEESIKKRVETRKKNGNINKDLSHLRSEDVVYKRSRSRIINQMKQGRTFNKSVLEKYNITESLGIHQ
jgi:hypothetical protein